MPTKIYNPSDFGKKEEELQRIFHLQVDDARNYFTGVIKPRLDRSYKLYIAYGGDRQREIKKWQSNVQVPYVQAAVETMVPRILDARPEFIAKGRNSDDQMRAEKQQKLMDFFWEVGRMDMTAEDFVRAALVYGTSFLQVSWKKDVRELQYLDTKDITKKYKWTKKKKTYFDGPFCEWVDNYNLWYDWHSTDRDLKQYWFKRLVLTESQIKRRYPNADKNRLEIALASPGGDLTDYASIRQMVKTTHEYSTKSSVASALSGSSGGIFGTDKYVSTQSMGIKMYEVFEWWRPFDDAYAVMVGGSHVPILQKGVIPIPYDFKEAPFLAAQYLKIPGEFEGYGLPLILESPQIILNLIKNQRLDAATLSIHKMWVVNPLANVNKEELVTRPFGIIYSVDPNGVREIQFSDIKPSSYKEEELLKGDMQYASGVDDFSMGVGSGSNSATEVRHLRESTLERVRMFVNHLGNAYSDVFRYYMDMTRQLFSKEMTIRIVGEDGKELFPLIEKDDLCGNFDYRSQVLPSIAGQDDVRKKQDMDLFQLLINLPFVDQQKLTGKVLSDWGWTLDSLIAQKGEGDEIEGGQMPSLPSNIPGMPQGVPMQAPQSGMGGGGSPDGAGGPGYSGIIPRSTLREAVKHLRTTAERKAQKEGAGRASSFSELSMPVNLMKSGGLPPTAPGIPSSLPNVAGHNRVPGGGVDTNIPLRKTSDTESSILKRSVNIQK